MDKPLEGGLNVLAEMVSAVKSKFLTEEHDEFEQEDFPEIIKEEIIKPTPKVSKLAILTVCPSGFEEAKAFVDDFVKPDYNNWEGAEEFETRFMEIVEKKFS